ncbi:hypothetical protein Aab01nite_66290 [Paractinoplanes abujensis]|uniref:Secreted protein n=1 Tax=Paractinoplanes abujensis TaxID=882441 RepID=A0A7W7G4M8_9ACTN|nr:hypothetical protein [Actinoplanes abujensis]MBB4695455.1 hypothetical protein [Actinoplanes abujensis]GID23039.1 hypothetical protein Aab01nite_66290 [Actinoplanes abujensis]
MPDDPTRDDLPAGAVATSEADDRGGDEPAGETPVGDKAGFRLAAFGAVLVVVLFAGYGLGRLNNSTASAEAPAVGGTQSPAAMPGMGMDESQPHTHDSSGTVSQPGATAMPMGASVGGLSLSSGGLTLVPETTSFAAGRKQRLAFRVAGAGGAPVTTYAVVHDKPLHLIVVRRDLTGFQHLHPTMAADGTWGIDLTLPEPGIYRMIADFTAIVGGQQVATTLGADLTVAGDYAPRALPEPGRTDKPATFTVSYEGTPNTQATQPLLMTVTGADGKVAKLDPYLGAFGHLVVMRQGDLAYVHVHPEATLVDGKVKFWLTAPSSGTYRMFFDFQVAGQVHTAAWTATID